jgi:hypothetical protein
MIAPKALSALEKVARSKVAELTELFDYVFKAIGTGPLSLLKRLYHIS